MEGDGALEHTVEIQCMYLVRWISDRELLAPPGWAGKAAMWGLYQITRYRGTIFRIPGEVQPERWELGHLGPGSGPWPCLDHHTNSNCPEEMHLQ